MRFNKLWVLAILILGLAVAALPAFAIVDGDILGYSLNAAGCYVDITFQVQDAAFYAINLWDDGSFRAGAGGNFAAGATGVVRVTIGGVILQGAAGIGVYLEDLVGPAATTTHDSDGSAQLWSDPVGTACAGAGYTFGAILLTAPAEACLSSISSGSVQGRMLETVQAVYEPRSDATTNVTVPAGTAWWVVGAENGYYKLFISCPGNYVWVPARRWDRISTHRGMALRCQTRIRNKGA
jgi:hypothetical protein